MSSERSVGIECFTTETPGFVAILKQRYSDFIVNEVDLSGNVLRLTDVTPLPNVEDKPAGSFLLPKNFEGRLATDGAKSAPVGRSGDAAGEEAGGSDGVISTALVDADANNADVAGVAKAFGHLLATQGELSAEQADHEAARLREFLLALQGSPTAASSGVLVEPLLLPAIANKQHRTAIHQFFKQLPFLHTDTVMPPPPASFNPKRTPVIGAAPSSAPSGAGFSQIRVRSKRLHGEARAGAARGGGGAQGEEDRGGKRAKGDGGNSGDWRRNLWPSDRPPFLQFLLYKENKDNHDAIGLLSKLSNVPMGSLAFAGTKDKRAVTTQAVTAFKVTSDRMAALNPKLHGMKVGNFKYVPASLGLGDLKGNRFTIVLRRLEVESEGVVAAAVNALKETGFINYYGLQRFGNCAVPTHTIGRALARGEWAAAVDLILQGKAGDSPDVSRAHELYKKGQVSDALRLVPRFMVIERALLSHLQKNKSDLVGALLSIPRTMRMMYLHSYQSYLWNSAASERVKQFGAKSVVVGDLVRVPASNGVSGGACEGGGDEGDIDELAATHADDESQQAVGAVGGDSRKRAREAPGTAQGGSKRRTSVAAVKVVTQEDMTAGTFRIEDVVLPLPGKSVRYPDHAVAAVYKRLARQDKVDLESCPHAVRDFSLPALQGDYRCIIQKPQDVTWSLARYSHPEEKLCPTDFDTLLLEQQKRKGRGGNRPPQGDPATVPALPGASDVARDVGDVVGNGGNAGLVATSSTGASKCVVGDPADEAGGAEHIDGALAELPSLATGPPSSATAPAAAAAAATPPAPVTTTPEAAAPAAAGATAAAAATAAEEEKAAAAAGAHAAGAHAAAAAPSMMGLVIAFTLPTSCYATMALRELMKFSSETSVHKAMNLL